MMQADSSLRGQQIGRKPLFSVAVHASEAGAVFVGVVLTARLASVAITAGLTSSLSSTGPLYQLASLGLFLGIIPSYLAGIAALVSVARHSDSRLDAPTNVMAFMFAGIAVGLVIAFFAAPSMFLEDLTPGLLLAVPFVWGVTGLLTWARHWWLRRPATAALPLFFLIVLVALLTRAPSDGSSVVWWLFWTADIMVIGVLIIPLLYTSCHLVRCAGAAPFMRPRGHDARRRS
jgi:hypothetical protein